VSNWRNEPPFTIPKPDRLLGNYHNQGYEGGEDCLKLGGPAPEFVHMDDINAELKLCKALLRPGLNWRQPWSVQHRRLTRNMRQYLSFLK